MIRSWLLACSVLWAFQLSAWTPCAPFCDKGCSVPAIKTMSSSVQRGINQLTQSTAKLNGALTHLNSEITKKGSGMFRAEIDREKTIRTAFSKMNTGIVSQIEMSAKLKSDLTDAELKALKHQETALSKINSARIIDEDLLPGINESIFVLVEQIEASLEANTEAEQEIRFLLNTQFSKKVESELLVSSNIEAVTNAVGQLGQSDILLNDIKGVTLMISQAPNANRKKALFSGYLTGRVTSSNNDTSTKSAVENLVLKLSKDEQFIKGVQLSNRSQLLKLTVFLKQLNINLLNRILLAKEAKLIATS